VGRDKGNNSSVLRTDINEKFTSSIKILQRNTTLVLIVLVVWIITDLNSLHENILYTRSVSGKTGSLQDTYMYYCLNFTAILNVS